MKCEIHTSLVLETQAIWFFETLWIWFLLGDLNPFQKWSNSLMKLIHKVKANRKREINYKNKMQTRDIVAHIFNFFLPLRSFIMKGLTKLLSLGTWLQSSEVKYLTATFIKICFLNACCIMIVLYLCFLISLNYFTSINYAKHNHNFSFYIWGGVPTYILCLNPLLVCKWLTRYL